MEWFLTILIFFGVMALTAVVFGGWVIVSLVRFVYRALSGNQAPSLGYRSPLTTQALSETTCPRPSCRAANPAQARFCRRCGTPMQVHAVRVERRVAML
jgi:hypothetical protein